MSELSKILRRCGTAPLLAGESIHVINKSASAQSCYAGGAQVLGIRSLKPYSPDFTTAFEHFCIHPGGKAVIEAVRALSA